MYNRYIRNDRGVYTRISEESPDPRPSSPPGGGQPHPQASPGGGPSYTSDPGSSPSYSQPPPQPSPGGGQSPPEDRPPDSQPSSRGSPFSAFFGGRQPPPAGGDPLRDVMASGRQIKDSVTDFLRHTLDRLHLDHVDTGDLLLLLLLFLLFQEDADEELMIALGLLLIL